MVDKLHRKLCYILTIISVTMVSLFPRINLTLSFCDLTLSVTQ